MSEEKKDLDPIQEPEETASPAQPMEETAPAEEKFTTLTPEGEDRRPITDRAYMKKRDEDYVDFSALAQAEDELHRLREEHGIEEKQGIIVRTINRYFEWKENRTKHYVSKKVYLLLNLFLGWCGMHRFYERRWLLGLFYLGFFWTGIPAALCAMDLFIAIPIKADENGKIWI